MNHKRLMFRAKLGQTPRGFSALLFASVIMLCPLAHSAEDPVVSRVIQVLKDQKDYEKLSQLPSLNALVRETVQYSTESSEPVIAEEIDAIQLFYLGTKGAKVDPLFKLSFLSSPDAKILQQTASHFFGGFKTYLKLHPRTIPLECRFSLARKEKNPIVYPQKSRPPGSDLPKDLASIQSQYKSKGSALGLYEKIEKTRFVSIQSHRYCGKADIACLQSLMTDMATNLNVKLSELIAALRARIIFKINPLLKAELTRRDITSSSVVEEVNDKLILAGIGAELTAFVRNETPEETTKGNYNPGLLPVGWPSASPVISVIDQVIYTPHVLKISCPEISKSDWDLYQLSQARAAASTTDTGELVPRVATITAVHTPLIVPTRVALAPPPPAPVEPKVRPPHTEKDHSKIMRHNREQHRKMGKYQRGKIHCPKVRH